MICTKRARCASAFALSLALTGLMATPALAHPGSAIVVDRLGQIWFLDTGDGLWRIDISGRLIRMGGNRFHWMTIDPDNLFAKTTLPSGSGGDIARVGSSPTLLIASDYPVAMGRDGNLYYPSSAGGRVRAHAHATQRSNVGAGDAPGAPP